MTEEQALLSGADIYNWLQTSPTRDDLYFYCRHLPDSGREALLAAVRSETRRLKGTVSRLYAAAGGAGGLPAHERWYYVGALRLYDAGSVAEQLMARFPAERIEWPDEARTSAERLYDGLERLSYLAACPRLLDLMPFMNSLQQAGLSQWPLLQAEVGRSIEELGGYLDAGELIPPSLSDRERLLLSSMKLFSAVQLRELFRGDGAAGRFELYEKILSALGILITLGPATEEGRKYFAWDVLKQRFEDEFFAAMRARGEAAGNSPATQEKIRASVSVMDAYEYAGFSLYEKLEGLIKRTRSGDARAKKNVSGSLRSFFRASPIARSLAEPLSLNAAFGPLIQLVGSPQKDVVIEELVKKYDVEERDGRRTLLKLTAELLLASKPDA